MRGWGVGGGPALAEDEEGMVVAGGDGDGVPGLLLLAEGEEDQLGVRTPVCIISLIDDDWRWSVKRKCM